MMLTSKETGLLKDLKSQEELCVQKYENYASRACSSELKSLFNELADTERTHLKTVTEMMGGSVPQAPGALHADNCNCGCVRYDDASGRKNDEFLCRDMLTSEKAASALYNVSVFEFTDPKARKMLNHIQSEEQQHGEKLWAYMNANDMSC